jgi:hypothetical protein
MRGRFWLRCTRAAFCRRYAATLAHLPISCSTENALSLKKEVRIMSDHDDRKRTILAADWQAFIAHVGRQPSVLIADLQAGDILTVVTRNHRYHFRIINGADRSVEITSNHPDFPGPYVGCLQDSVLNYSESRVLIGGRVMIGFCVVWSSTELLSRLLWPDVILTATQEVLVNGIKVLPADDKNVVQ